MSELGKPVRTWQEVLYADTTCLRYNITVNRYENGEEYDTVDAVKEVNAIPIEWIEKYLEKWEHAETYDVAHSWWLIIKRDWEAGHEAD